MYWLCFRVPISVCGADVLERNARSQCNLCCRGGDEFVIVLSAIHDIGDVAAVAERIVGALSSEFHIQGRTLKVSCSLGISICPDHGADSQTLINNADAAMYGAKENGRNQYRFFTTEMNAHVVEHSTLEHDLQMALPRNELFLMYQPQIDIRTNTVVGLEVLLRWRHPERGLVSPEKFIRAAENSGAIVPIGEWVLRTACSQVRAWQEEGLPAMPIAVNVSAIQFRQDGFKDRIREVLTDTGIAPQYLELELTESLLTKNADVVSGVLQDLKNMGLKLAIDDFGTGCSSLSYLRLFPLSKLKIDGSFIRDAETDCDAAAIATAIIGLAKSLHLKVIAEGVETASQLAFLRAHQCDEMQGYYFSPPLEPKEVAHLLRTASPLALRARDGL